MGKQRSLRTTLSRTSTCSSLSLSRLPSGKTYRQDSQEFDERSTADKSQYDEPFSRGILKKTIAKKIKNEFSHSQKKDKQPRTKGPKAPVKRRLFLIDEETRKRKCFPVYEERELPYFDDSLFNQELKPMSIDNDVATDDEYIVSARKNLKKHVRDSVSAYLKNLAKKTKK